MMKTFKTILITLFVTLSFAACKKDEDGQWIRYYKDKVGIGYVFYVDSINGKLIPAEGIGVKISAYASKGAGMFVRRKESHQYVYSDYNGKYVFNFAKAIGTWDVVSYAINDNLFLYPSELNDFTNELFVDTLYYWK